MKKERVDILRVMLNTLNYYRDLADTWANDPIDPETRENCELLGAFREDVSLAIADIGELLKEG